MFLKYLKELVTINMYSYNSIHKIIGVLLVIGWAIFQFRSRSDENLKYDNGDPIRTGNTENNLNHGVWSWYHENGQVQITGTFIKGKREGVWKSYDTLGNLMIESTYKENLLNGTFKQFAKDGKIIRNDVYKDDILVNQLIKEEL